MDHHAQHEYPKRGLVLGPILQSYPPFTVRQQRVEGTGDMPPYSYIRILAPRSITVLFRGKDCRITETYDSRADLPWVIYALRLWLADRPRMTHLLEEHLEFLQRPEEIARLTADLAAEQQAENARSGDPDQSTAERRTPLTAEQVLANQRDELERIRQLTDEVEHGLQTLEAAHPEAVAALDEVTEEISRTAATRKLPKG